MSERSARSSSPSRRRNTPRRVAARRVDQARLIAWQLLRAVDEDDAYANLVLPQLLRPARANGLSDRDAALATELGYGTLRMQGQYDAIIAACVDRAFEDIDPGVRDALRLGAHQLLATRIPPHAAVASTVDLVRAEIGSGASGFANAVLRRISAHDVSTWVSMVTQNLSPDDQLAVRYSHPAWVVRALREALIRHGRAAEELPDLLNADNLTPVVTLAALPGLVEPGDLGTPFGISPIAVRAEGDPGKLPAVQQGLARVQDAGSQVVTLAFTDAPVSGPDAGAWLDMCAGPGGKSALAGAVLLQRRNAGALPPQAQLRAVEVSEHRCRLVRGSVAAVNHAAAKASTLAPISIHQGDARDLAAMAGQLDSPPGGYDRVLLDAPCSGLGALRRRPESRWRRQPSDLAQLGVLQRELLAAACAVVRPGGIVGYVTCSPHIAETLTVVTDGVRDRTDMELIAAPQQLWPHVEGTDAMYLALLRKRDLRSH